MNTINNVANVLSARMSSALKDGRPINILASLTVREAFISLGTFYCTVQTVTHFMRRPRGLSNNYYWFWLVILSLQWTTLQNKSSKFSVY